jgi:hypothetical protein
MNPERHHLPRLPFLRGMTRLCGFLLLVLAITTGCDTAAHHPAAPARPGLYLAYEDEVNHYQGVVGPVNETSTLLSLNRDNTDEVQITVAQTGEDDASVRVDFDYTITSHGRPPGFQREQYTFSKSHPTRIMLFTRLRVTARYQP